jgi:hypothetical protein
LPWRPSALSRSPARSFWAKSSPSTFRPRMFASSRGHPSERERASHRIFVGRAGSAPPGRSTPRSNASISLKLVDPNFNAPIYANLVQDEMAKAPPHLAPQPQGQRRLGPLRRRLAWNRRAERTKIEAAPRLDLSFILIPHVPGPESRHYADSRPKRTPGVFWRAFQKRHAAPRRAEGRARLLSKRGPHLALRPPFVRP